jgi:hypothetical protein
MRSDGLTGSRSGSGASAVLFTIAVCFFLRDGRDNGRGDLSVVAKASRAAGPPVEFRAVCLVLGMKTDNKRHVIQHRILVTAGDRTALCPR